MSDLETQKEEQAEKKNRTNFKKINDIKNLKITTSITFKSAERRQQISNFYPKLGFKTMNQFIMALIDISMNNENIQNELKKYNM